MKQISLWIAALLIGLTPINSVAETKANQLFGAKANASRQNPAPIGSYAKGCLAGGMQLAETGPTWQAMRLSRNRNWGHPDTIAVIQKLSAFASTLDGWEGLYIGDISQPRGGPMTSGHASHQLGLDADIWMNPVKRLNLTRKERENISAISMRRSKGAFTNKRWTPQHRALLRAAAKDPRVARIFVFPGAKVDMCKHAGNDRKWLNKIRPWWGHHYHFHVRLACPRGMKACKNQNPPPRGDGCKDAQKWVNDILDPPPPKKPDPNAPKPPRRKRARDFVMSDLPRQCLNVLKSK